MFIIYHKLVDYFWCCRSGAERSTNVLAKWMSMDIVDTIFQSKPHTCKNIMIILCLFKKPVDYF